MLITFEGGEGSGKSTQVRALAALLEETGHHPVITREPGGTDAGTRIREVLLDPALELRGMTELLLFNAARHELVESVVRPALQRREIVIIDRYADSTRAYQGAGRGLARTITEQIITAATGGLEPDLTFLLDLDPREGLRRAAARGTLDRLERADLAFHDALRAEFLNLARAHPRIQVVDAARDAQDVHADIARIALAALNRSPQ